jgi:hypothetical protein
VITPYGLRVMLHDTDRQGMFVRGSALPTGPLRETAAAQWRRCSKRWKTRC